MPRKPFLIGAGEKRFGRFLSALRAATRQPGEEAIHDLRVAIRRLLAFLELASALSADGVPFPPEPASGLVRLMKPLGRLRDAHVKLLRIGALAPAPDPVTRKYALAVLSDAEKREAAIARTLARTSPRNIRKAYRSLPLAPLPPDEIRNMASARLGACEAEVVRLSERFLEVRSPDSLHELRLAFKELRYTAEALSALLPGLTPGAESRLHDFQALLGDIRDFDVMLAEFRHFREKVLGIRDGGNDIERVLVWERDAKWRSLLSVLQSGKGIRALFVRR